ncbi:LytTR family DNA-binding domain-containing protein [Dyadobacter sp. CY261]|uniref:LytR/AlgR family response regulator transcription factor n=1 Tax=Dyadobacter sp. CY261 TaxID=2907203 RepID=UPI001F4187A9|nr:LytTR family DNA-binding domain-containing protein [Dyadobacter sp. CY261]MCF0070189.1 LytTR family DNA-binding domain-containing protein [Dyadobacter sp. CY261]
MTNKIKCLIIDDEPYTAHILEAYISELESLELVGTFYDAVDALRYLQQHKVDLLFLDIMLPKITGEAFLRLLPSRPRVVFLAAKKKRWRPGDDDYILHCLAKPIAFEDFLESIDRCYAAMPTVEWRGIPARARRASESRGPFAYLFSAKTTVKVFFNEVLYIEGVKNYAKIKTTEKEIVVYQGLSAIEARLVGKGFMRIHRSLIVAIDKITAFNGYMIEIDAHILPVSTPYRGDVTRAVGDRYLRKEEPS